MMIYTASSGRRNQLYPHVIAALRAAGHDAFCWKEGNYKWSEIPAGLDYAGKLNHPIPTKKLASLPGAILACDVFVLLWPCGVDSHSEYGFALGRNKPTIILGIDRDNPEPDLWHGAADVLVNTIDELLGVLSTMNTLTDRLKEQRAG
jgi:hypothetical protein